MSSSHTVGSSLPAQIAVESSFHAGRQPAVGERVRWLRTSRRGYGFQEYIHATVVGNGRQTVRIRAPLKNGGTKLVSVHAHNLFQHPAGPCTFCDSLSDDERLAHENTGKQE